MWLISGPYAGLLSAYEEVSAQNPHQTTLETYKPRLPDTNTDPFASPETGKRDQNKMPTDADNKRQAARDVIDILEDISKILVCSLVPSLHCTGVTRQASETVRC